MNNEPKGLKRSPEVLAADLIGFLTCIGSYLPFDHVYEILVEQSTNFSTVWQIVYEIYDADISSTNYLDYASMVKQPQET